VRKRPCGNAFAKDLTTDTQHSLRPHHTTRPFNGKKRRLWAFQDLGQWAEAASLSKGCFPGDALWPAGATHAERHMPVWALPVWAAPHPQACGAERLKSALELEARHQVIVLGLQRGFELREVACVLVARRVARQHVLQDVQRTGQVAAEDLARGGGGFCGP
jgi:hypothetical protein